MCFVGMNWIKLAQGTVQSWAFVNSEELLCSVTVVDFLIG